MSDTKFKDTYAFKEHTVVDQWREKSGVEKGLVRWKWLEENAYTYTYRRWDDAINAITIDAQNLFLTDNMDAVKLFIATNGVVYDRFTIMQKRAALIFHRYVMLWAKVMGIAFFERFHTDFEDANNEDTFILIDHMYEFNFVIDAQLAVVEAKITALDRQKSIVS